MNSHFGSYSLGGLLKLQRAIAKVKTPFLEDFFISLESYWSVDVQNGFAWPIWTFATQVMARRKAGNQIGNLTPDHGKLGIDSLACRRRATRRWRPLDKDYIFGSDLVPIGGLHRKYSPIKLRDSEPWRFQDSHLGVSGQKAIRVPLLRSGAEYTIWGKVVASPKSGPRWVLWVWGCPWLVLTPKVLQPSANQLACWFCVGLLNWVSCLTLVVIPSRSSSTPLYPL
jgi:hypothetical protein